MGELILYTGEEVAQILKVSKSKAYSLMQSEIPVVRLGRLVRVRKEDLEAYVASQVSTPSSTSVLQLWGTREAVYGKNPRA